MQIPFRDVIGSRGEKVVELCLSDYTSFKQPLFQAVHLGDKWPAVDFYVELNGVKGRRPFFFVQCKTTKSTDIDKHLKVTATKDNIAQLLQIPGPTYLFGVHEPTRRIFVKSIHSGLPVKAVTRIELQNELTHQKLKTLFDEVVEHWRLVPHKPTESVFIK